MRRVLGALVVLVAVACGVPEDDRPQELSADEVPFGLLTTAPTTTTTPVDLPPERQAELYFVDGDGDIAPVEREVADRSAETVIETLLATESSGLPTPFSSSIPPDTTLLDIFTEDDVLTVDLSEQFDDIEGERQIAAVAQIVFTATGLEGIDEVAFRVEGEDRDVNNEDGATQDGPVSRNDYRDLLAT